jgi:hypothetical protein
MAKCKCGCGEKVNPGRSFVQGHNNKHIDVKHSVNPVAHKTKRKTGRKIHSPIIEVIDNLLKRRKQIDELIEKLRDIY